MLTVIINSTNNIVIGKYVYSKNKKSPKEMGGRRC